LFCLGLPFASAEFSGDSRSTSALPFSKLMAVESKPRFHPEVIRQQVRSFDLPQTVQVQTAPAPISFRCPAT
jgi:hypothetical protein